MFLANCTNWNTRVVSRLGMFGKIIIVYPLRAYARWEKRVSLPILLKVLKRRRDEGTQVSPDFSPYFRCVKLSCRVNVGEKLSAGVRMYLKYSREHETEQRMKGKSLEFRLAIKSHGKNFN